MPVVQFFAEVWIKIEYLAIKTLKHFVPFTEDMKNLFVKKKNTRISNFRMLVA